MINMCILYVERGEFMKGKKLVKLLAVTVVSLLVFGTLSFAEEPEADVTLTVTPSINEIEADSEGVNVTYTITLTPAEGKKIGYFEFRLNPSAGITVNSAVINSALTYHPDFKPNGIFENYAYASETMYLLCAGTTAERNLANEAVVLTVDATVDASVAKNYTLALTGARAAIDGSSAPYSVETVSGVIKIREPEKMDSSERAQDAIILKVDNSLSCTFGKMVAIDSDNKKVVPYIYNERTLVPLRFVSESLGAEVVWEEGWNYCFIKKGDKNIKITFGSADIEVDGKVITYDAPIQVVENRTMVPIRFISEELGYHVHWNAPNRMIAITPADNPWVAEREAENTLLREVIVTLIMNASM